MAGYQKESVFFPSADGKTRVAGYFYAPETPNTGLIWDIRHVIS